VHAMNQKDHRKWNVAHAFAVSFVSAGLSASPLSVANANSSITVDARSVFGLSSYVVDGVENDFEQSYWTRGLGATFESPLSDLPVTAAEALGNQIMVAYSAPQFDVQVRYLLMGGLPGSHIASLLETLMFFNRTGQPLPLTLYMETDLDVGGTAENTAVGDINGITQSAPGWSAFVSANPIPDGFQIASFPDLFLSLGDTAITNLTNTGSPFGPGDASFAFQWNAVLPVGSPYTVSVQKAFVPEPATWCLTALGFGTVLAFGRRRQRRVLRQGVSCGRAA
jgi:PEP-CTERM motif